MCFVALQAFLQFKPIGSRTNDEDLLEGVKTFLFHLAPSLGECVI